MYCVSRCWQPRTWGVCLDGRLWAWTCTYVSAEAMCWHSVCNLSSSGGALLQLYMVLAHMQVDCLEMDPYMTELFGRGSREGLLHWLRDGTLLIENIHKVREPSSASTGCTGPGASPCQLQQSSKVPTATVLCTQRDCQIDCDHALVYDCDHALVYEGKLSGCNVCLLRRPSRSCCLS